MAVGEIVPKLVKLTHAKMYKQIIQHQGERKFKFESKKLLKLLGRMIYERIKKIILYRR